jgi:phosphatidate cytidylyltransferase
LKELTKRTLSGIVFVLVIILLLRTGGAGMFALILFTAIFALTEFYRLSYKAKFLPYRFAGTILGILSISLSYMVAAGFLPEKFLLIQVLILVFPAIPALFYQPSVFYGSWLSTLTGLIYIVLPLALLPFIAFFKEEYNFEIILGVFILLWVYDSFAYLIGSWIGKNKIFPKISPKKSWEGAAGGLTFAIAGSLLLYNFFGILGIWDWFLLGIIIPVTGTIGDFIESGIKRNAGVKDSGSFMPGHGGVLDRFDSFLFSIPFVFLYIYIIQ